jgi:uncharacterized membrane protein YhdT
MTGAVLEGIAVAACGLLVLSAGFQVALGSGAPWAAAAYGGRAARGDGRLPGRYRAASLVTALVLAGIAWSVLLAGGVVGQATGTTALRVACWVFAALFAVNTLGNVAGRHPVERWGMGAITGCLTVLCVLLAVG